MLCPLMPNTTTTTTVTTYTILMQDDKRGDSPRKQVRLPAIAPKDDQSSSGSNRSSRVSGPAVPPRARLPPRSRTGCWTCRQRKVKCDEGRPVCGQCGRLGHTCDYSPRLSFRDDTTRVVERTEGVTVTGSTVWDRQFALSSRRRQSTDAGIPMASPAPSSAESAVADDLPPFATLMTDEERERKAEASSPGTYNVVVNPGSFQHLPEYSDDVEIKRERLSPLRRGSIAASLASTFSRDSTMDAIPVPGDPNTIVLPRFEDLSRKTTREMKSPTSPVTPHTFIKIEEAESKPVRDEKEEKCLEHFRTVVWRQLVPTETEVCSSVTLIDKIAEDFPPLLYAMLATASQSIAQRQGTETYDALQHYTNAIRHLKNGEDSASDGVFLTHFLMLVYEIATADTEHSQIRTHHLSMLRKIALLRRDTPMNENFPYIIWWICNIDLDALFSGAGTGEFVVHMLENEAIPPPSYHLFPLGSDGSSLVFTEETETLPTILQLDYEVTLSALRLARLSQELRRDESFGNVDPRQRDMTVRLRQSRIYETQEALRQLWMAPRVLAISQRPLPLRSQRVWEHAFSLFKASLIYSHTSMWSAQRLDTLPDFDDEIAFASTEILQLAQSVIYNGSFECRYLVFPVFMAGFASTNGGQKMVALDLISRMERESIGRNTVVTGRALELVYERQNSQFMSTGHSLDVDWMDIMGEHGLTVINFGM